MRTKVTPLNPASSYQTAIRNRLSTVSAAWRTLTPAQIHAWNAGTQAFAKTDVFGDIKNPSGVNLHQALNNNLLRIGVAAITTPPLPVALPVIETGVLAAAHAGAITVTFTNDPVITASVIEVYATPAMSPGRSFVKSELRLIGLMPTIAAHVTTLTTLYNTKFGAVGAAGQKTFVMMRQISNVSGQAGIGVILSCINT